MNILKNSEHPVHSTRHPYIIILTQDCDLGHDYFSRYPDNTKFDNEDMETRFRENPERYRLSQIIVCVAQQESEIKSSAYEMNSKIFYRVKNNQEQRFHHLGPWRISKQENSSLDLYVDFKRTFSLQTSSLYNSVYQQPNRRIALVPQPQILDLSHRHACFFSRIPLP